MDWLANGLSRDYLREPAAGVFPLINVTEDKDKYYVRAELPGLNAGELDIPVTGDSLSIAGERKLPVEDENAQYHRRERDAGSFSRILNLPAPINTANVEARSSDGVLTVILPKAEEAKPRQIAVKSS
jgi:HSP20 family protein